MTNEQQRKIKEQEEREHIAFMNELMNRLYPTETGYLPDSRKQNKKTF